MAPGNASLDFFDRQFRRQIAASEYLLNPFEKAALPYLRGSVLDLGCGLGNLALAAAHAGARVTALDACPSAVGDLQSRARAKALDIEAAAVDLSGWRPQRTWDAVACIGLLMFFPPGPARAGLAAIGDAVAPGGVAVVNVLIEGTTFLDMFDPHGHYLFAPGEVAAAFPGWDVMDTLRDDFTAPRGLLKRFETVIARRPAG
jgi:tellurite methyltransferase